MPELEYQPFPSTRVAPNLSSRDLEILFTHQEMEIIKARKQYPQNAFWKKAATLRCQNGKSQQLVLCSCAGKKLALCLLGH